MLDCQSQRGGLWCQKRGGFILDLGVRDPLGDDLPEFVGLLGILQVEIVLADSKRPAGDPL